MRLLVTYNKHNHKGTTSYAIHKEGFKDFDNQTISRILEMAPKVLGDNFLGHRMSGQNILTIDVKTGSMKKGQDKFDNRAFFGWVEVFLLEDEA